MADRLCRGLVVQRADLRAGFLHPDRDGGKSVLEPFLQGLDRLADPFALLLGQFLERVRLEHPAVLDRREEEAGRCPQERDALVPCLCLDRLDGFLLALLQLVLDDLTARSVGLVLEGGFQGIGQVLDQPLHVGGEPAAEAGSEMQGFGAPRLAKVADVADIVARLALGGGGIQRAFQDRLATDAAIAHDEEVAAGHGQGQRQVDGVARPGVAEWRRYAGTRLGERRCHVGRVDLPAQLRDR